MSFQSDLVSHAIIVQGAQIIQSQLNSVVIHALVLGIVNCDLLLAALLICHVQASLFGWSEHYKEKSRSKLTVYKLKIQTALKYKYKSSLEVTLASRLQWRHFPRPAGGHAVQERAARLRSSRRMTAPLLASDKSDAWLVVRHC